MNATAFEKELNKRVGRRLKMKRKEMGYSQSQLADRIGVSIQQLQKYESGDNSIAASRLHIICVILNIEPDWLFEDENSLNKERNTSDKQ